MRLKKLNRLLISFLLVQVFVIRINSQTSEEIKISSSYYYKGIVALDQGDYDRAIELFNLAIELDHNNRIYYYALGSSHDSNHNEEEAIVAFTKAIELNSKYGAAYYRRALCIDFSDENSRHMSINDFSKAILYYEKGEIHYKLDQAYCFRGYIYGEENKYREAILDFNSALKINPNNYSALDGKARTKRVLGDYKGSILIWNKLIKIFPENSEYYFDRGKAKFLLNDLIGACADFSKAGDLGEIEAFELLKTYCQ